MRVTLIGSGNIANVLGKKVFHSGHIIHQVFSRNPETASQLANELSADQVTEIDNNADIFIVAVPDDALQHIDTWLKPIDKLVVHTAGSVSIDVLKTVSPHYGVLWPVQSIRKETVASPNLPVVIDANNQWNKAKLTGFAQSFADAVSVANDQERQKLHLAAVATNNFSNYLFTLAEDYCKKEGVDFNLLLPLLHETISRMELDSPSRLQTGPAIRNDMSTIEKHKGLLKGYTQLLEVYEFFTKKIKDHYK